MGAGTMMYSPVSEHTMKILGKAWKRFDDCLRSRLGWILAGFHGVWFFVAVHDMGPPSRAAAAFRDSFEGADFTIFAGRWFHLRTVDCEISFCGRLASHVIGNVARTDRISYCSVRSSR